jgi:hypothetical protein
VDPLVQQEGLDESRGRGKEDGATEGRGQESAQLALAILVGGKPAFTFEEQE